MHGETMTILFRQDRNLNNYLTPTLHIYNTETLDIVIHYETVQGYNSFSDKHEYYRMMILKYILKSRPGKFGLDLFGSGWGSACGCCAQGNKFRGPQ